MCTFNKSAHTKKSGNLLKSPHTSDFIKSFLFFFFFIFAMGHCCIYRMTGFVSIIILVFNVLMINLSSIALNGFCIKEPRLLKLFRDDQG